MWYPKKLRERCRRASVVPNLPDLNLLCPPQIRGRGDGLVPEDYDYRFDDALGRVHWKLEDQTFVTVRYYFSSILDWPERNDDALFRGYALWQEYLDYEVFWTNGECQWNEFDGVLIIDSYAGENSQSGSSIASDWEHERRYATLRLLQMDWTWKRDGYGFGRFQSFQHPHDSLQIDELDEISRLVWNYRG